MTVHTSFVLPALFVIDRVLPTGAELAWGYSHGWVSPETAVAIALAKFEAGVYQPAPEEEIALLLSDDLDRVPDLLSDLEFVDEPAERRARVWLFLALAYVFEHRREYADPLGAVESLYGMFDYPAEIQGLVRYMPTAAGSTGVDALMHNWEAWIGSLSEEYRNRRDLCT